MLKVDVHNNTLKGGQVHCQHISVTPQFLTRDDHVDKTHKIITPFLQSNPK